MTLNDQQAREQATDPRQSFIVQAPAGSGKTEMLSQRFLRLLAVVQAPEQIIALTFTRKAAAEMRERIIISLQRAANGETAQTAHQQQTLQWANAALQHSNTMQWNLLKQPHRLRIMTIDSLCQQICKAIPLQERSIPFASVNENASLLYQKAARSCIHYAFEDEDCRDHMIRILGHLDNNQSKLIDLFCQLLANREQWLPLILNAKSRSRQDFENDLQYISNHEIARLKTFFPPDLQPQFLALIRLTAEHSHYKDGYFNDLKECYHFDDLTHQQLQAIIDIVLTKQDTLRSQYDHNIGIKKDRMDEATYQHLKLESTHIQTRLKDIPGLAEHLSRLRCLPEPHYQKEQWEVLQSLLQLLPQLAAHLHVWFTDTGQVDFLSIAQQAGYALGSEEDPADLALYFDNTIHHLLIDEFQDTSLNQYELIHKLVMGWEKGDGRTLFLVGDPMQSIYRFRQAEVGLFLKAREQGIGPVSLTPLELSTNFRSSQTIVEWVNQQFMTLFPRQDDIEAGAITYHHSDAIHAAHAHSFVAARSYTDSRTEARGIIDIIRKELQFDPTQKIAILVRSRSNLLDIMDILRQEQIPFQGVDIDLLGSLPHIQDVWSLTRAFLFPANRLAWLSLLRSPFCGLSLTDIHQLVADQRKTPFLELMEQKQGFSSTLSAEGWQRLDAFMQVMRQAITERHQYKLVDHLALMLQRLGADSIFNEQQQADIEQFWRLVEQFEQDGVLADAKHINAGLQKLYAQQTSTAALQVMTIHKSKGLEFDTVLLPHLGAKKKNADNPLIRWLTLPQKHRQPLFLLAPLKAEHEAQSSLYNFLKSLDAEKDDYEIQRLLYVAVTRARHRLYLCSHKTKAEKNSLQSLLSESCFEEQPPLDDADHSTVHLPRLQRMPLAITPSPSLEEVQHNKLMHQRSYNPSAIIGTLCHTLLQWASEQQTFTLERLPWSRITMELRALGITEPEQHPITEQLKRLIESMFSDKTGRWILANHPLAMNEVALMETHEQGVRLKIPDRIFRDDQGQFWVVDFKTGLPHESNRHAHIQQVVEYARMIQQVYACETIRCGIYYLENQHWHSWLYPSGDVQ